MKPGQVCFILFWLFGSCTDNHPRPFHLLKCENNPDKNEEIRCYFYYRNQNIWDTLLVANNDDIEIYRLQYFSPFSGFYLHSLVSIKNNHTARKHTQIYIGSTPEAMQLKHSQSDTIEVDRFYKLISTSRFWETEAKCNFCDKVGDGDTYILEGWKNNNHKVIHRDSPESVIMYLSGQEKEDLLMLLPFFREMKGNTDVVYEK